MANKTVIEGSKGISVSQMGEFWRQVGDGSLRGYHLDAVHDHRNPFPWYEPIADLTFGRYLKAKELHAEVGCSNPSWKIRWSADRAMLAAGTSYRKYVTFQKIPIVRTTVSHFGLQKATYHQICERIIGSIVKWEKKYYKFGLCPHETGALLMADYFSQRNPAVELSLEETMIMIAEPVTVKMEGKMHTSLFQITHTMLDEYAHGDVLTTLTNVGQGIVDDRFEFSGKHWLVFALYDVLDV